MDPIEHYNRSNYFGIHNNLELTILDKGKIEYTMQLEKKHFATDTLVHGGTLAGFMDAILSVIFITQFNSYEDSAATG